MWILESLLSRIAVSIPVRIAWAWGRSDRYEGKIQWLSRYTKCKKNRKEEKKRICKRASGLGALKTQWVKATSLRCEANSTKLERLRLGRRETCLSREIESCPRISSYVCWTTDSNRLWAPEPGLGVLVSTGKPSTRFRSSSFCTRKQLQPIDAHRQLHGGY